MGLEGLSARPPLGVGELQGRAMGRQACSQDQDAALLVVALAG